LLRALPRVRLSRAVGRLCDRTLPRGVSDSIVRAYSRAYRVNLDEAADCPDGYCSFDAFFTRRLRDGARSVSSDPVVSPADGVLSAVGSIDPGMRLWVKGRPYDVGDLIADPVFAERYRGGEFAVVYLAPGDYHRVHSPVEGRIVQVRGIPGDLFPVNAIGERHVPRLFVENSRVAIQLDTNGLGQVMAVMVGAVIVGRMSATGVDAPDVPPGVHRIEPPIPVERGGEIGIFHLGSTVVLLLEPGLHVQRRPGRILYGESLVKPA
jgi:phosphatidylserine decarboxylase